MISVQKLAGVVQSRHLLWVTRLQVTLLLCFAKYMENLLRVIFPDAVQSNVLIGWGKNENQNNNVVSTHFIVCQC